MHDSQPGNLPPCELSSHCSRLLDELVGDRQDSESRQAFVASDRHDQRLIIQLRAQITTHDVP